MRDRFKVFFALMMVMIITMMLI